MNMLSVNCTGPLNGKPPVLVMVTVKVQVGAGQAGRRRGLGHRDVGAAFVAGDVVPRRFELGAVEEAEAAGGE